MTKIVMNNKFKNTSSPLVYSTDPNYVAPGYNEEDGIEYLPANEQKIKVLTSTKHRGGKIVTLLSNVSASAEDQEQMSKALKTFCGTGGSYKDGEIIIQGDQREKVLVWLHKNGYKLAKKG